MTSNEFYQAVITALENTQGYSRVDAYDAFDTFCEIRFERHISAVHTSFQRDTLKPSSAVRNCALAIAVMFAHARAKA